MSPFINPLYVKRIDMIFIKYDTIINNPIYNIIIFCCVFPIEKAILRSAFATLQLWCINHLTINIYEYRINSEY